MVEINWQPDDTGQKCLNRSLSCGELPKEHLLLNRLAPDRDGCGARNWRVFQRGGCPPWTRLLVCQSCGTGFNIERSMNEKCGNSFDER
jgi:hypothetical protein